MISTEQHKAESQIRDQPPRDTARLLFDAAGIVHISLFGVFIYLTAITAPFWDMFGWIDDFLNYRQGQFDVWSYVWKPHNDHHLLIIRLLTALDVSLFGTNGRIFIFTATTAMLATAVMVYSRMHRTVDPSRYVSTLGLACAMLLLTTAASVDCSVPINSVYPLALVFMVTSILVANDDSTNKLAKNSFASTGFAVLASLSNAVGLLAFPILAWTTWRIGAGWRRTLAVGLFGCLYGTFYVQGLQFGSSSGRLVGSDTAHLVKTATYLLTYLGLPFSRAPGAAFASRILGAVMLLLGATIVLHGSIPSRRPSLIQRIGVGMTLIGLGSAALASLGRVDIDQDVKVPVRYAILVAPLHIGLLIVAFDLLRSMIPIAHARKIQIVGGSLFVATLLTVQIAGGFSAITAADRIRTALARYNSGIRDAEMEHIVFPNLTQADRIAAALARYYDGR